MARYAGSNLTLSAQFSIYSPLPRQTHPHFKLPGVDLTLAHLQSVDAQSDAADNFATWRYGKKL